MDQHHKLRLKVCTNTGLNIMCTVNKDWTVDQLYPHITRLYKQVTQDQGGNHIFVHITTLKKNNYYIPKSQIVGQIFNDGDQVNCNVEIKPIKSTGKKERMNQKKNQKESQKKQNKSKVKVKEQPENTKNNKKIENDEPKKPQKPPKNANNNKPKQPQPQSDQENKNKTNTHQETSNNANVSQQKNDKKKRSRNKKKEKNPQSTQNKVQNKTIIGTQELMNLYKRSKVISKPESEQQQPQNNIKSANKQPNQPEEQHVNSGEMSD